MLESGWLFTGVVAVLLTVLALLTQTSAVRHFGQADGISIVLGALGTIAWGIFAYGSLDVVVVDGGVTIAFTMPTLTLLSIAMSIVPIYVMLTGPYEILSQRYQDMDPQDY